MMMHVTLSKAGALSGMDYLIVAATRCWRRARDSGMPVQQHLYAVLSGHGWGVLAPVFDGLLAICETALGRRLAIGDGSICSRDELLLCDLLDAARPGRSTCGDSQPFGPVMDGAIRSARIMIGLVIEGQSARFRANDP